MEGRFSHMDCAPYFVTSAALRNGARVYERALMFRPILLVPICLVIAIAPATAELLQPEPGLPPERVVEIQLRSLQRNNVPTPDAGIKQTWLFAHPDNKRLTGPLARFTEMIKGPHYRMLLGHRSFSLTPIVRTATVAIFSVSVVTASGETVVFDWQMSKVGSGQFAGAWMTLGVSPPLRTKDAI